MDLLDADLSVLPAATLANLATWLTNAIRLRISGAQPEALEDSAVEGLQIRRTSLDDLHRQLTAVYRAQAIQAATQGTGGLNIISSSRRDMGGGAFGRRRSSFS